MVGQHNITGRHSEIFQRAIGKLCQRTLARSIVTEVGVTEVGVTEVDPKRAGQTQFGSGLSQRFTALHLPSIARSLTGR